MLGQPRTPDALICMLSLVREWIVLNWYRWTMQTRLASAVKEGKVTPGQDSRCLVLRQANVQAVHVLGMGRGEIVVLARVARNVEEARRAR